MKYRVVKLVNGLYQVQDDYFGDWNVLTLSGSSDFISTDTRFRNRKGFTTEKEALDLLDTVLTLSGKQEIAEVIRTHPKPTHPKPFLQRLFGG